MLCCHKNPSNGIYREFFTCEFEIDSTSGSDYAQAKVLHSANQSRPKAGFSGFCGATF